MSARAETYPMLATLRRLLRLRGPFGALAFATAAGVLTGLVALNLILAAWTYRDAARRDRRAPGRWALAVLVGGVFAFGPYVLLQWLSDRSQDDGVLRALRRAVRERRSPDADGPRGVRVTTGDPDAMAGPEADPDAGAALEAGHRGSLAVTTARYGVKAAGLGVRGARWAGRRAAARMNNR